MIKIAFSSKQWPCSQYRKSDPAFAVALEQHLYLFSMMVYMNHAVLVAHKPAEKQQ